MPVLDVAFLIVAVSGINRGQADCSFQFGQRVQPFSLTPIVPIATADSLVLLYQDGLNIAARRHAKEGGCEVQLEKVLNQSEGFARAGNGLAHAVAFAGGLAVTWAVDGQVVLQLFEMTLKPRSR